MSRIDPTARIEDGAVIGAGTSIGPYCTIGPQVSIGENCRLIGHAHITGQTTIGANCTIYPFASLGAAPQISNQHDTGRLTIGSGCTIRESVTISSGSPNGRGLTSVGDRGYFMNGSHVAHDCIVGNDVIFATSATLGGHCEVGDFVFMGGLSAAHQFSRIGAQVMVGGLSGVTGDVIPYAILNGSRGLLEGLNTVGMKRRKFTKQRLQIVNRFYNELFHGPGLFRDRLERLQGIDAADPAIAEIMAFIKAGGRRPLVQARPRPSSSD